MGKHPSLSILLFLLFLLLALPASEPALTLAQESGEGLNIQPLLVIERVNAEKAVAGSFFYVTLVIQNYSDYPAFNIFATVSTPGEDKEIFTRVTEATAEKPDLEKIEGHQRRSLTFAVNVSAEAKNKDYTLLITLQGKNALFKDAPPSSASITVPVVFELTRPFLTVSNVVLDPPGPSTGEPFTAVFYLDNYSSTEARNVTVELDGQKNFQLLDVTDKKFIKSVARGAGDFVLFKLQAQKGRSGNAVSLKFTYDYAGETQKSQDPIQVNLPLGQPEPGKSPFLKVSSFSLAETARRGEHLFRLTLENQGEEAARNITITLDGGGNIYVLYTSNIDYIESLAGKTSLTREYTLGINPSQGTIHYPLKVVLSYADGAGNSFSSTETLGLSASTAAATAGGTPRVLISKYTLSDEKILAGNIVTLSLFIENTNSRPVYNTKVSFKAIEVEGSTGGTVFSPVNSSNSFFLEQIPGRTILQRSIDFLVDPNAAAKTYIVPVTIEYEDESANTYSVNELINIPVTQECKLQVLALEIPPVAFIGQPLYIGAEFVNVGKAVLNNFIVMLEGDFRKEQASYYAGNLQIGASDYYQGIIYPEREGTLSGKLIFSYIDNNNKEVRVEEPFTINVQPMGAMEPIPGEKFPEFREPGMDGGVASRSSKFLLYTVIPAAAAVAAGLFLWRRKIKKKNEEYLDA